MVHGQARVRTPDQEAPARGNVVPALSATAMTAIAVIGLTYRAERKRLVLAWDSIGILAVYIVNFVILRSAG